jgi:hypothetical protein
MHGAGKTCTNLCLVPLSCFSVSISSSNAAMRRLALASVEVGTAPSRPGITSVEGYNSVVGSDIAAEASDVKAKVREKIKATKERW